MIASLEALLVILNKETACYREMKTVLDEEADSISMMPKGRFDRIQNAKESLVLRLQRLEKKRQHLVDELGRTLTPLDPPTTVSQLASYVKSPYDSRLQTGATQLRTIMGTVQTQNRNNQLLINQYLGLIEGSIKLLSDLIDGSPIYHRPGTQPSSIGFQSGGGRILRGTI